MGNVVQIHRPEPSERWASGEARCMDCGHRWVAAAPVATVGMECPSCAGQRGMWRHPFGAKEGDEAFTCNICQTEHVYAVKRDGRVHLMCAGCGADHSMAIWEAN